MQYFAQINRGLYWKQPPPTCVLKTGAVPLVWSPFQILALCFMPFLFQMAKLTLCFNQLNELASFFSPTEIRSEWLLLPQLFSLWSFYITNAKGSAVKGAMFLLVLKHHYHHSKSNSRVFSLFMVSLKPTGHQRA